MNYFNASEQNLIAETCKMMQHIALVVILAPKFP